MPRSSATRTRRKPDSAPTQLTIFRRGGARKGAGRKPKGARALVSHATRPVLTLHDPILVTTKLVPGCPNLRNEANLALLQRALASGADRFGFRLVEYSVQTNHLHLIAEAEDERSLARGMQGPLVRVAKRLNRAWSRRGKVLFDRYHARILRTPSQVRAALLYVLQNARKHGARLLGIDACSSGRWFTGWIDRIAREGSVLPGAGSWLLTAGWRRIGLLHTSESPSSGSARWRTRAPP